MTFVSLRRLRYHEFMCRYWQMAACAATAAVVAQAAVLTVTVAQAAVLTVTVAQAATAAMAAAETAAAPAAAMLMQMPMQMQKTSLPSTKTK